MARVDRKSEIEPIDGTPEKRMFWSIISDYDMFTGLAELVDNAIDLWMSEKRAHKLEVKVTVDAARQLISIEDNAGGIRRCDLRMLVAPGGSNNRAEGESIGVFGVGSKRAVIALAESIVIKTHHRDDRSYQIDITKDWMESPDWALPAYEIPDTPAGVTSISLSMLRRPISEGDVKELSNQLGEHYSWFLRQGGCDISLNGTPVVPVDFDAWAYPPDHCPRKVEFEIDAEQKLPVVGSITSGLVVDRNPDSANYGVYVYCNHRLVVKELKVREVGYFVTSEAGVPHPDASLCRVIVDIRGPAKLMPWNSSKTGVNFGHIVFQKLRPALIQLVKHYSSLSRRLKEDREGLVFQYTKGAIQTDVLNLAAPEVRLLLPELPKLRKPRPEQLKALNKDVIRDKPYTLGLLEAMAAIDVIERQKLETRNRVAIILLDSNFEIALKEFIVNRVDLFKPTLHTDGHIRQLFGNRHTVIEKIKNRVPELGPLLEKARYYYELRNKLIHERATAGILDRDVERYRDIVEELLSKLFGARFEGDES